MNENPPPGMELLSSWWKDGLADDVRNDFGGLLMRQASVVGATCVYLGNHRRGLDRMTFDLVVIDEAGRATPPELLLPMTRGKRIVLVGDHHQLPPFIEQDVLSGQIDCGLSDFEIQECVEQSLFQRLYLAAPSHRKAMLDTTFRLPKTIGKLVSQLFYQGKLKTARGNEPSNYFISPLVWLDTSSRPEYRDRRMGTSRINEFEAQLILDLLSVIIEAPESCRPQKENNALLHVAVMSPYAAQIQLIGKLLSDFEDMFQRRGVFVEAKTIDAYQGNEADLVIYASTRSGKASEFLNDRFRLNVALSRAKHELIIIGSSIDLTRHAEGERNYFSEVFQYIQKEGSIVPCLGLGRQVLRNAFTKQALIRRRANVVSQLETSDRIQTIQLPDKGGQQPNWKSAVVDVGSKGFRLLSVGSLDYVEKFSQHPSNRNHVLLDCNELLRMADDVLENGEISINGINRLVRMANTVTKRHRSRIPNPKFIPVVGTSLFRNAPNFDEIKQQLRRKTRLELCRISGLFEATVGVVGMIRSMPDRLPPNEPVVCVDIGGGSTEITLATWRDDSIIILERLSFGLGTQVVYNVLRDGEVEDETTLFERIHQFVQERIADKLFPKCPTTPRVVGIGGCLTTFVGKQHSSHGRMIHRDSLLSRLGNMPPVRREQDPVDVCLLKLADGSDKVSSKLKKFIELQIASEVLLELLKRYQCDEVLYCGIGLRHALAYLFSLGYRLEELQELFATTSQDDVVG